MNDQNYDIIVIGTGLGGAEAAKKPAKESRSGAVIHSSSLKNRRRNSEFDTRCPGDQAAEIVYIGQAIMAQQGAANTLHHFVNTTFNYPTMAEAYRVAALNGPSRLA